MNVYTAIFTAPRQLSGQPNMAGVFSHKCKEGCGGYLTGNMGNSRSFSMGEGLGTTCKLNVLGSYRLRALFATVFVMLLLLIDSLSWTVVEPHAYLPVTKLMI